MARREKLVSGEKPKSKVDNIKTPEAKGQTRTKWNTKRMHEQPKIQVTKQPQNHNTKI